MVVLRTYKYEEDQIKNEGARVLTRLYVVFFFRRSMAANSKVTPDFHLTYSEIWGKSGVGIKMIKMDNFQHFSIKSYVVDMY